jgi:hypothetical protein
LASTAILGKSSDRRDGNSIVSPVIRMTSSRIATASSGNSWRTYFPSTSCPRIILGPWLILRADESLFGKNLARVPIVQAFRDPERVAWEQFDRVR